MSTIARLHRGIFTHLLHFGLYGLPLAIVATLSATPVKSVYVQPFTTATQSTKLYKDLTAELRRITAVTLVENPANADAVLDGGGEIWVQGYRSLNPRSGRLPSDGTPIYDGYLAVELKDAKGQTFWSDLVTPGNGSGDISKALARRIAKGVAAALAKGEPAAYLVAPSPPSTVLKGMGATFPAPVYVKWFTNYRIANPNLNITYDAVGSEAGRPQPSCRRRRFRRFRQSPGHSGACVYKARPLLIFPDRRGSRGAHHKLARHLRQCRAQSAGAGGHLPWPDHEME